MDEYGFSAGAMGAVLASPALSLALLAALVVWAAASDLKSYTIPNAVCGLTAALAIVFHLQAGGPIGAALLVGAVTLAVGFAAYALRLAGAGDAKLMAAVALFAGPVEIAALASHTLLLGGGLAILWAASRPVRHGLVVAGFDVAAEPPASIPYGLAIAGATGLMILRLWPAG